MRLKVDLKKYNVRFKRGRDLREEKAPQSSETKQIKRRWLRELETVFESLHKAEDIGGGTLIMEESIRKEMLDWNGFDSLSYGYSLEKLKLKELWFL